MNVFFVSVDECILFWFGRLMHFLLQSICFVLVDEYIIFISVDECICFCFGRSMYVSSPSMDLFFFRSMKVFFVSFDDCIFLFRSMNVFFRFGR